MAKTILKNKIEGLSYRGSVVKNLPAMQETWVRTLGREDTPKKGMAIHSRILAQREVHGQRNLKVTVHGATKSRT